MYIYHALINALSIHMIHININMIFYTHVEHNPPKTIYIKYYKNIYIYIKKNTILHNTNPFFLRCHGLHSVFNVIALDSHCSLFSEVWGGGGREAQR